MQFAEHLLRERKTEESLVACDSWDNLRLANCIAHHFADERLLIVQDHVLLRSLRLIQMILKLNDMRSIDT